MASDSQVEEEKSSDNRRKSDEEFSADEDSSKGSVNDDDDANGRVEEVQPPVLQPHDVPMDHEEHEGGDDSRPPSRRHSPSSSDNEEEAHEDEEVEDDDGEAGDNFPACYPENPPIVDQMPQVEYPVDTARSSPSERNLDFNRMVQNNFVPFSKGLKGDAYRRRTNYEHQQIMGYVFILLIIYDS